MKNYLSTFLVFVSLFIFSFQVKAQIQLGGGLSFGAGISKLGINLRGLYDMDEKFVAAPGVNFFFKDKSINDISLTYFSVDLDARYKLLKFGDRTEIFPVGGINVFRVGVKGNQTGLNIADKGTKVGLNLGLGAQVESPVSNWNYFGEFKFTIGGIDQSTITAGVLYGF